MKFGQMNGHMVEKMLATLFGDHVSHYLNYARHTLGPELAGLIFSFDSQQQSLSLEDNEDSKNWVDYKRLLSNYAFELLKTSSITVKKHLVTENFGPIHAYQLEETVDLYRVDSNALRIFEDNSGTDSRRGDPNVQAMLARIYPELVTQVQGGLQFKDFKLHELVASMHVSNHEHYASLLLEIASEMKFSRIVVISLQQRAEKGLLDSLSLVEKMFLEAKRKKNPIAQILAGFYLVSLEARDYSYSTLHQLVRNSLVDIMLSDNIDPPAKGLAGSVVSIIGDTRNLDEMVYIPGGLFLMGSDGEFIDERPLHNVYLKPYYISKYLITNEQYHKFTEETRHRVPRHWNSSNPPKHLLNHPVVYVSWHDAIEFSRWYSKNAGFRVRLPSEAEWEKAARGTEGNIYPWGNEEDPHLCNTRDTGIYSTTSVGIFNHPSPFQCFDMSGNVWEWTRSLWGMTPITTDFPYPYETSEAREDEYASDQLLRIVKGGAFHYGRGSIRAAFRGRERTDDLSPNFGFRVVRLEE